MNPDIDLLIIGAGPAGICAALSAIRYNLNVVLVDQNHNAGGQVFRPLPAEFSNPSPPDQGSLLRQQLADSSVRCYFEHTIWNISSDLRVDAVGSQGPVHWQCKAILVATGTTERVVPFPGWTLPGVFGLAAATIMLKSQRMLPGTETLLAGCGPLLSAVATGVLDGGGKLAGIVDSASRWDWIKTSPKLMSRPDLSWQGAKWLHQIYQSGTPFYSRHVIEKIEIAESARLKVTLAPINAEKRLLDNPRHFIYTDSVVVGNGLTPSTDITRLLRAKHHFDRQLGGWVVTTDSECRTSVSGIYAAGDGCGVSGAAAAMKQGELAGLSVAHDQNRLDEHSYKRQETKIKNEWLKASRFGRAMGGLMALPKGLVMNIPATTIVCRCEDVTRADIEAAIKEGATSMDQIKAWTRCGMGPCQGRTCSEIAAELAAEKLTCTREMLGYFTGRAPLRPVSLEQLTGEYSYADIPLPKAAPL